MALGRLSGPAAERFRYGPLSNRPQRANRGDLWWDTDGSKLWVWSHTAGGGAGAWIGGGLADGDYGDVTVGGGGTTITIDNNAVTFAKMQDIGTQRIIGRNTAGTGDPEALTLDQVLDWLTTTHGSVIYRGASSWAALAPGTLSYLLSARGPAANPQWRDLPSPLTNGDPTTPELIFALGDVIMVEGAA